MFRVFLFLGLLCHIATAEAQVSQSAEEVFNSDIFVGRSMPKKLLEAQQKKSATKPCIFQSKSSGENFDVNDYRNSVSERFFAENTAEMHSLNIDKSYQRLVVNLGDEIYIRLVERPGTTWNYDVSGDGLTFVTSHKIGNILTLVFEATSEGGALIYFDRLNDGEVTAVRKAKIIVGY